MNTISLLVKMLHRLRMPHADISYCWQVRGQGH